jgi:hypothetical protein
MIIAVVVAGAFIGINNTLTTQAVMTAAPVERPVASAAYGFVRFIGGGLAPFVAEKPAEHLSVHVPFYAGAGRVRTRYSGAGHRTPDPHGGGAPATADGPRARRGDTSRRSQRGQTAGASSTVASTHSFRGWDSVGATAITTAPAVSTPAAPAARLQPPGERQAEPGPRPVFTAGSRTTGP